MNWTRLHPNFASLMPRAPVELTQLFLKGPTETPSIRATTLSREALAAELFQPPASAR